LQDHHTFIEIIGKEHPTLFSEITTILSNLHCNITEAHIWSHNTNFACIAYISDQSHLASIEKNLSTMLCDTNNLKVKTSKILGLKGTLTCTIERRLHQLMMLSIDDFDEDFNCSYKEKEKIMVTVESCKQRGYTIVNIECKDHSRLMFDIVCTLTDMDYDIFHAYTRSQEGYAFQVYTLHKHLHIYIKLFLCFRLCLCFILYFNLISYVYKILIWSLNINCENVRDQIKLILFKRKGSN
jgi:predicted amino acid-binding ACT domain protein